MNEESSRQIHFAASKPIPYTVRWFLVDANRWLCMVDLHPYSDILLYDARYPSTLTEVQHFSKAPPECLLSKVDKRKIPYSLRVAVRAKVGEVLSKCNDLGEEVNEAGF